MNYAVIIVTYNRLKLLQECLECVDNQIMKFNEIIIINNCSTDGTTEFLEKYSNNRENINLINTDKNLGGSGGFELGVKSVSKEADFVLLIDDDAMLDIDFLKQIDMHRENKIEAYSGTVSTDGKIDTSHRRLLSNSIFMLKKDVPRGEYQKEAFLYDLSSFCGLMISKKIVDRIGFPKGEYFIWYDDTEYSLRINKYTKIKNINSARINHKTVISSDDRLNWKSYYGYRNQIDVGKRFSKFPWLYKLYRYTYHEYRAIQYRNKAKKNKNDSYFLACSKLHKAVIRDSKKDILGLSEEYYPGKKLE